MNTNIHMILETLSFSFGMAKEIIKYYRVFIWKSKVFSGSSLKKKNNNTK